MSNGFCGLNRQGSRDFYVPRHDAGFRLVVIFLIIALVLLAVGAVRAVRTAALILRLAVLVVLLLVLVVIILRHFAFLLLVIGYGFSIPVSEKYIQGICKKPV